MSTMTPIHDTEVLITSTEEQFAIKHKMKFSAGEFDYVDLIPEKQVGEKIIVAPGTPMNWSLMKTFLLYLVSQNRRVISPIHPDCGFFATPSLQRPEVLERLLKEYGRAHCIGHSYGGADVIRLAGNLLEYGETDLIKSAIVINSPGFKKNTLIGHFLRYQRYVRSGKTPDDLDFLSRWKQYADSISKVRQLKETWDIVRLDLKASVANIRHAGIPITLIQTNDTMLYNVGVKNDAVVADIKIDNGGNHNGILYKPELYCGPVIVEELHRHDPVLI